jgi:preprotein translocase subunit YajC
VADEAPVKTQTAPASNPPGGEAPRNPLGEMLPMFIGMGLIIYFLMIRPESKRRKEKENLLGGIKPKDKVVTIGGLHGTVVEIDGDDVVLLVDNKKDVKMKFRRSAIDVVQQTAEEKKDEKK